MTVRRGAPYGAREARVSPCVARRSRFRFRFRFLLHAHAWGAACRTVTGVNNSGVVAAAPKPTSPKPTSPQAPKPLPSVSSVSVSQTTCETHPRQLSGHRGFGSKPSIETGYPRRVFTRRTPSPAESYGFECLTTAVRQPRMASSVRASRENKTFLFRHLKFSVLPTHRVGTDIALTRRTAMSDGGKDGIEVSRDL